MSVRERARLSAIALGLGGAALALIQILENTVSQFSPRPVVSALLTVTVAMAGVSLGRARSVATRQQFLTGVLWRWPMPTAAQADPLTLGIFPAQFADESALGPYVPRSVDAALDEALSDRVLVLVIGPARAGKSRSAYEAVMRSMPDRRLLNPIDGDALRSIIGDARLAGSDAVWWLDDLDRHLPSLDGRALNEILTGGHVVIASLRDDAWQALLSAGGTTGAQGRRLLAAAHTIHLPAKPDGDELAAASRLYPDVDVTGGIGVALSADGSSSRASTPSHASPPPQPRRRPDPALVLALVTTFALAGIFALTTTTGGFSNPPPPPPVAEQLAKINAQNTADKLQLVYHTQADLRGPGEPSWIYVWRSPLDSVGAPTHSDRIEIYDDVGGRLKLHLDFTPATRRHDVSGIPFEVHQPTVVDLDGTGQENEFIVAYVPNSIGCGCLPAGFDLPIVAAWNGNTGRYALSPLLPLELPSIVTNPLEPWLAGYYPLADNATHLEVAANAVSSFAVVPAHGQQPALLAALGQTNSDKSTALFIYAFLDPLALTNGVPSPTIMCDANQPVGQEFTRFRPFPSNAELPGGTAFYQYSQQLSRLAPKLAAGTTPSVAPNSENGKDDPTCE